FVDPIRARQLRFIQFPYTTLFRSISPVTKYILESMIPYTDANLRLAFKPRSFFYELSKKNKIKEKTVQSAYYRAIRQGLLEMDGDRKSTRLNSSHVKISYAVFCLK